MAAPVTLSSAAAASMARERRNWHPIAQERLSKDRWMPPWVRHQHQARYEWVAAVTRGCLVADVACGAGGAMRQMAISQARRVDGFDISLDALNEARAECGSMSGRIGVLALAEATRLPVKDCTYDACVSLETIEHLVDDRAFLAELVRILKPGGRLFCSTPNRALTNPAQPLDAAPFNRFHVREYSLCEFAALLREFFPVVEIFGQAFVREGYALLLDGIARTWPVLAVRLHQLAKAIRTPFDRPDSHLPGDLKPGFVPEFLLAVCAKAE